VTDYLRVGVPLVWVIYPKNRCVRVVRSNRTAAQLGESDELDGEDVLPGFRCAVARLFAKK
jgi:Uma2 family endonuclease